MKIKIDVTAEDILNGKRGSPSKCPIALGAKRVFPTKTVRVVPVDDCQCIGTPWNLSIDGTGCSLSHWLDSSVGKKASHFDYSGEMEPFSFEFEL